MDLGSLNTMWVWVGAFIVIVLLFLSKINLVLRLSNKSGKDQELLNKEIAKAREKLAKDFENTLQSIDLNLDSSEHADLNDLNAQRLLEQSKAFREFREKNQSQQVRERAQSVFKELDHMVVKKPSTSVSHQETQ